MSRSSIMFQQHDCVNFICDHPDIRAISFVGGDPAGRHIYNRGSANGKRVQVCSADLWGALWIWNNFQCNMGAKNHGVIMPDANKEYVVNQVPLPLSPHRASYSRCSCYPSQLVGAAFGAAGQRCMALTTAVMVWTQFLFFLFLLRSTFKFDCVFFK